MRLHGSSSETRTYQKKQGSQWVPKTEETMKQQKTFPFHIDFETKFWFFLCLKKQTCSCLQCGRSSSNAKGSKTFPEIMCPPVIIPKTP